MWFVNIVTGFFEGIGRLTAQAFVKHTFWATAVTAILAVMAWPKYVWPIVGPLMEISILLFAACVMTRATWKAIMRPPKKKKKKKKTGWLF